MAGYGWFRGPHCFPFFSFMFGSALEGKLRIIGGTLACISVFEIERRMVGLCMSITAGIAANAQLTFFVC